GDVNGGRTPDFRINSGWHVRRDGGVARSSAFHWLPVPSRVQVEAVGTAPIIQDIRGCCIRIRAETASGKGSCRSRNVSSSREGSPKVVFTARQAGTIEI